MQAANEYIPIAVASRFRQQALKVWFAGLAAVLIWLALILAAPVAKAAGDTSISDPLYKFFSFICHQMPSRSFFIEGEPFGVCSRCFGIYSGLVVGFLIYPLWRRLDNINPFRKIWLFAALVPIGIDWSLTVFGIWENTFTSRYLTGLLLGTTCATFMVPAIVEITRNATWRRLTADAGTLPVARRMIDEDAA